MKRNNVSIAIMGVHTTKMTRKIFSSLSFIECNSSFIKLLREMRAISSGDYKDKNHGGRITLSVKCWRSYLKILVRKKRKKNKKWKKKQIIRIPLTHYTTHCRMSEITLFLIKKDTCLIHHRVHLRLNIH